QFPEPERPGLQRKDIDVFRSFTVTRPNGNFAQLLSIVGRLKQDVDLPSARAEMTTIRVARPFSRNDTATAIRVDSTAERLVRRARLGLNVLMAAVVFL